MDLKIEAGVQLNARARETLDLLRNSEELQGLLDPAGLETLEVLIQYGEQNNIDMYPFLFETYTPSVDLVSRYRNLHGQIYTNSAKDLALEIHRSTISFTIISSGMYAGKSTLADSICNWLKQYGYRVIRMVPDFMGDFVTIRGRESREGDQVDSDGYVRISAIEYKMGKYKEILDSLNISPKKLTVIHFDEFSFLPPEELKLFIDYVSINYPNVKILFVGLNRNTFGSELPSYKLVLNEYLNFEIVVKSFVPHQDHEKAAIIEPTGTFTQRHILVKALGISILDLGFLPIVVPKELGVAIYSPVEHNHHFYNILRRLGRDDLISEIINGNENPQREAFIGYLYSKMEVAEG